MASILQVDSIQSSLGASAISFDSAGRVTHPNQPAFWAIGLPSDRYSNSTNDANPVIYRDCVLNQQGGWNGTVGSSTNNGSRFTAPTAGLYYFAMEMMYKHAGGGDATQQIYKNGTVQSYNNCHFRDNAGYYPAWTMAQVNWLGRMAANDYIEFYFRSSADGSSYMYGGGYYNKCFGWLVG